MGDQSLVIAYWLPETGGYVDERGNPVVLPAAGSGGSVTVIEQRGERIAALVHDATVLDDPALSDAVASAARLALSNVLVTVLVADDGVGGADPSTGSGLNGIADRVEALGGWFLVDSPAGGGTRLLAEIPVAAGQ